MAKIKLNVHDRRRRPIARSLAQRRHLVARFERRWEGGLSRAKAAEEIGVSVATIDRWRREIDRLDRNDRKDADSSGQPDIATAVACLSSLDEGDKLRRIEALFIFMAWLRWPTDPADQELAVLNCMASYFGAKSKARRLAELPRAEQLTMAKFTALDLLRGQSAAPYFDRFKYFESDFDDLDLTAFIVRLMLDGSARAARYVSLTRAFKLIEDDAFIRGQQFSERGLQRHWSRTAPSAPFLYVDYYSDRTFLLNPEEASFAKSIDELLADSSGLRHFFQQSRWVVEELSSSMDPRALRSLATPAFPEDLEAIAVPPPGRSKLIEEALDRLS